MEENKSNRIFLLGSVVLGVLAVVISLVYLNQAGNESRKPGPKVLVAQRDIRDGADLNPEKDFKEMDLEMLSKQFLQPDQKNAYKGERVNHTILAGTPMMLSDFLGAPSVEPKGDKVAMAIPLRKGQTLLIPGDWVQLWVTRPIIKPRTATAPAAGNNMAATGVWEAKPVLDHPLKIILSGSRRSRLRETISMADAQKYVGVNDADPAVLVELTEEDVKTILEKTGEFTLSVTLVHCTAPKSADGK